MSEASSWRIFREMMREEWRLHGRLFGGRRFLAFPVLVGVLVAGSVALLEMTGTPFGTVVLGLHALAFLFGLHTGSIGLVGRDALEDLLGDVTLIVFSARTLPLSSHRLLGIFVLKDVVYYASLFLLPMAVGVAPALAGGPVAAAATMGGLWLALTGMFVLGVFLTLAGVGLASGSASDRFLLAGAVGGAILAWWAGVDLGAFTAYGVFVEPTPGRLASAGVTAAAAGVVAGHSFEPRPGTRTRTAGPSLRRWRDRVGDVVAAKTLLDLFRSSGGVGKVLFSGGILLAVTVALVDLAEAITGVVPSVGVSYGTVLGLSGFTTYNWLTRFDDVDAYTLQPLDVDDVFRGKLWAFLLTGPPTILAFYALGVGWKGTPAFEAIVGAILAVGVAVYVLGVTAYLAGFAPNEFLFDTVLFAAFAVALSIPLVPILVLGFGYAPLSATQLGALAGAGVVLALVGMLLYRGASGRWRRRLRE